MRNLNKFRIARVLFELVFWVPVGILYFQYRGLNSSQMLFLVSIQSLLMVIFEFPTGVIGDYFGHKTSVTLGYLLFGVAFMLCAFEWTFLTYCLLLSLSSLGMSLASGSDTALMYSISNDFKKDNAELATLAGILQAISLVLGGFIGSFNLGLTFFLSGLTTFIGAFFLLSIKVDVKGRENRSDIVTLAKKGLVEANTNKLISYAIYSSAIFLMVGQSLKWIAPTIFETEGIPTALFGLVLGSMFFFKSFSGLAFKKLGVINPLYLSIIFLLSMALMGVGRVGVVGVFLVYFVMEFYMTQTSYTISEGVDSEVRASVLSYRSLLTKLIQSGFLSTMAFLVGLNGYNTALLQLPLIILMLLALVFFATKRFAKVPNSSKL